MSGLFDPVALGPLTLPNRLVLAPLTRNRAGAGRVPSALAPTYYAQRASAGLLITEASQISPQGIGYPGTPGIHTPEQIAGWRKVTEAVHAAGGRIFIQLWHVGRISHPSFHNGALPVAPSAIAAPGDAFTETGLQPFPVPRALELSELPGIVADYAQAARNAIEAGFDGVEVHGANGYLLDQFLRDGTNHRTDAYGGPVANRARLLLEVVEAVTGAIGRERVGVRLSPNGAFNGISDSDPATTFGYAASELDKLGVVYLHTIERFGEEAAPATGVIGPDFFRARFSGRIITNGGYGDRAKAEATLARGDADLIAFGTAFLANPDLPARLHQHAPLNTPDRATFYGGGAKGYTDYPTLAQGTV